MNYRSTADLARLIAVNLHRIPQEVDVVVGIPRSGLLAANLVALALNKPLADLDGLCEGRFLGAGEYRIAPEQRQRFRPEHCAVALIVDDSVASGKSMQTAREKIRAAGLPYKAIYCAAFVTRQARALVDLYFEICPMPRMFEWNFMHHPYLAESCVDLDGVLCLDPTPDENDDGKRYADFVGSARPRFLPTSRIGCIVTCRLERYRQQTEEWLRRHGVAYDQLVMLDLPDAETRRRLALHGRFKAEVFRRGPARVFIESERHQAMEIAYRSGKYALSVDTQEMFAPDLFTVAGATQQSLRLYRRIVGRLGGLKSRLEAA